MTLYKVTIHEHRIYDSFIEAPSQALAEEAAEEQIIAEDNAKWREDYHANWTEVGDIEVAEDWEENA
jgi:hypothetical protein